MEVEQQANVFTKDEMRQLFIALKNLDKWLSKSEEPIPELLSFQETCSFLNIKESKLRKLVFENAIPVKRLGRSLRFSKKEIINWLDVNSTKPN